MAEPDKKQNFWTTLPGLLTGLAALMTAVTGFLVVMHPRDAAGGKAGQATVTASPTDTPGVVPSAVGGGSAAGSVMPKQQKPTVLVVGKDGTETRVFLKGFQDSYSGEFIKLKTGQSIPFDKIGSVEFPERHGYDQDVKVTLTDGRTLEGDIMPGEQITGETDIGPFSTSVTNLKRISFER